MSTTFVYKMENVAMQLPTLVVGIGRTRNALRHDSAARGVGDDLWLLSPLNLLYANLSFD